MKSITTIRRFLAAFLTALVILSVSACAAPADPATEQMEETEHGDDHEHEDEHADDPEHDDEVTRLPNDGAVIEIVSPEQGASFEAGEDIVVEITVTNFTLNEDGSHWHVYVDGESFGMVVGETYTQVLRGLEPGEHTINAYLTNGDHEEFEDGGEVMIVVTE